MILYSKRTAETPLPGGETPMDAKISYIYWDFDKCAGGHLDKDKNIIPRPSNYFYFSSLDSFYSWHNTYKQYWQEPTSSLIEDYLQVDEGL